MRKESKKYLKLILTFIFLFPLLSDGFERRTPVVVAVEKAAPAVVNISTEKIIRQRNPFSPFDDDFFFDFFNIFPHRDYKQQSLGSGVIIDPQGYILTNEHVIIKAASRINITTADQREFTASLIGSSVKFDLAILKIDGEVRDLSYLPMGTSSDLMIGEPVIAIGNPFGLSHTVTTGIISALNRTIQVNEQRIYRDFIQTDTPINPGNSGGPLLNINGELIGINTAIYQNAEGIGFAIPIDKAKRVVDNFLKYGEVRPAWTGIFVQDISRQIADYFKYPYEYGVLITKVIDGSPADMAGLKSSQIIAELGGIKVKSASDFNSLVMDYTAGSKMIFKVFTDNKFMTVEVQTEEMPLKYAEVIAKEWLGISVINNSLKVKRQYNLLSANGVVISKVEPNSKADYIGLRPGDIIHRINSMRINNVEDFQRSIADAINKDSVLMTIQRGEYLYYVAL